jgi:fatty-acyl-CoA synthase
MVPKSKTAPYVPQRVGEFDSLAEGLDYASRGDSGFNFFSGRAQLVSTFTYRDLREHARDLACRLCSLGFSRGDRLAIAAETSPDFAILFFACQYAGLIPVPLPLSLNIGGHEAYVTRLRGLLRSAQPVAAVASVELVSRLHEASDGLNLRMVGTPAEFYALPVEGEPKPLGKNDPCYVQYSSGSTTAPKGILLTQRALTSNARAIGQYGLRLVPGDRATSWLPLYHDMGLVGFFLTPMLAQVAVDFLPTSAFALRPRLWLKLISEYGGTISYSPTFGYELCVRRGGREGTANLTLQHWRVAGVGGEMVRPNVLARFADLFATSGFDRHAFVPSYGLAEATLAISFSQIGGGARVDVVDRDEYERTGRAAAVDRGGDACLPPTRAFTICGRALPGYAVEMRDENGRVIGDRQIGRIMVRGPSLMAGYLSDLEESQEVLEDGWLDTGDMGYLVAGELIITGRRKDLIIVNGRNIWPQDLEWSIERVPGIRSGSVAAFTLGTDEEDERVAVVVECYLQDAVQQEVLRKAVLATIQRTAGVHCQVILVPPRSLPFTSSGKLSRAATKARYLDGSFVTLPCPAGTPDCHQRLANKRSVA